MRTFRFKIILTFLVLASAMTSQAAGKRMTFTFEIGRQVGQEEVSVGAVNSSFFSQLYGLEGKNAIVNALSLTTLTMQATYTPSAGRESFYRSYTCDEGFGHWFSTNGMATTKTASKAIQVCFDGQSFLVSHNADKVTEGSEYTVKESFIMSGRDTLTYEFRVAFGTDIYVRNNQPAFVGGRPDRTASWPVKPLVKGGKDDWTVSNCIQVNVGEDIVLSAEAKDGMNVRYAWANAKGNTIQSFRKTADFTITSAKAADGGTYVLKVRSTDADGKVTVSNCNYFIDIQTAAGDFYDWPSNTATFSYNFKDEYPDFPAPKKTHNIKKKNGKPANVVSGEWWSAHWGDKLNPMVGQDSATVYQCAENMIKYFENEFAYIRDVMGWPPDLNAREGWKSYIYIFGSGLEYDSTDSLEQGGYQGWYSPDGFGSPCVTCSYLPFSRYRSDADKIWGYSDSEWQRSAMIHEGIHAILATMKGVKGSSWFHEAGNTWLQGKMAQLRSGGEEDDDARAGWLDGGPFLAPFMPIECYSGWLQDGSFGGPGAEGVNRYDGQQQICTWRRYLGGTQYGNSFPYILSSFCGNGSIPWIWNNCEGRVLEGIGNYVGDEAMRKIILQYRSRMAIYDFDGYKSYRNIASDNFGAGIGPEYEPYYIKCDTWKMTPYSKPVLNDADGWLAPDTLTNPGWSGANFIPLHVDQDKNIAEVEFRPEDTNMMAQLCYRTKDGTAYYSQPVSCGTVSIDISKKPANGVIILVVANTDYIYTGEAQRKYHWDYRIRLGEGTLAVADIYKKWFFHEQKITDEAFVTDLSSLDSRHSSITDSDIRPISGMILRGHEVKVNIGSRNPEDIHVRLVGLPGAVIANGTLSADGTFMIPNDIPQGLYVATFAYNSKFYSHKLLIK